MMTNLSKTRFEEQLLTVNHVPKRTSVFSFLTDFKAGLINSKTTILPHNLQLLSRITTKGKIKFSNADFCKVVGISSTKIQKKQLVQFFHPEMPKVIMNYVVNNLDNNKEALAIIKQIDSKGNTIWLNSQFTPNNSNRLNIACHIKSVPTSKATIDKIERIYKTVHLLENNVSFDIAQKYFEGLLEMEYGNYDGFIINAFQ